MTKKPKEEPLDKVTIFQLDRSKIWVCKQCRKRESCFVKPQDTNKCVSLEKGEPYIDPYEEYLRKKEQNELDKSSNF